MSSKYCPHCKLNLQLDKFYRNAHHKDGASVLCKGCYRKYEASAERRVKRTWNTIHFRVKLQNSYNGILVNMTRDDFLAWAIPEYKEWMESNPGKTPSLDRIDPSGNYEIGNLRVISRGENARLAKNHYNVHAPDGLAWCGRCKKHLPKNNFWKQKSSFNGLQKKCKPCQKEAIKESLLRRGEP